MNKKILSLLLFMIAFLVGCAPTIKKSYKDILPRQAFLKIEKQLTIKGDGDSYCGTVAKYISTASGFVVRNTPHGAYVITAEHVCDVSYIDSFIKRIENGTYDMNFKVIDVLGDKYNVEIIKGNSRDDICLLWVKDLYMKAVEVSRKPPVPGDRVYNLAAPLGIFQVNMIPIQEGFYNGEHKRGAFYSIPAAGGSSGSPILNSKGELVGMIHSVYRGFDSISISPTYANLTKFINASIDRHHLDYMIDIYMKVLVGLKEAN
jgi:S1-C subfamily serine protease